MRFGIQAVGSEGDVRPLIALGAGLRTAGHQVTMSICSDRRTDHARLCETHDLQLWDSGEFLDFTHSGAMASSNQGSQWHRELHQAFFVDSGNEEAMYRAALDLCQTQDVMISHYLSYPAKAAVVKTGIPHVSVQLTDEHTPTRHRPARIGMPNLGDRLNLVSWQELLRGSEIGLKQPYLRFWNSKGLPPFDHLWSLYFSDDLNLLAISRLFCPQQPDWDGLHLVTGFLDLPVAGPAPRLSDRVEQFLAAGEPPVFMTFGSAAEIYPGSNVDQNIQMFLDAANQCGCRAVIQTSGGDAGRHRSATRDTSNDKILFTDWISYEAMFARSALVVHHSGIGTCQLSLKCNCPSVLVPFTDHQSIFAHQMHQRGVCPRPIMRSKVTAESMAAQIDEVLSNSSYKRQAAAAGEVLRREDGVRDAVEAISRQFGAAIQGIE